METAIKQTIIDMLHQVYINVDWVSGSNVENLQPQNKERLDRALEVLNDIHNIVLDS